MVTIDLATRGVQKVCCPSMKEHRDKGHSMHANITSQYKNIYQEESSLPENPEKLMSQSEVPDDECQL